MSTLPIDAKTSAKTPCPWTADQSLDDMMQQMELEPWKTTTLWLYAAQVSQTMDNTVHLLISPFDGLHSEGDTILLRWGMIEALWMVYVDLSEHRVPTSNAFSIIFPSALNDATPHV